MCARTYLSVCVCVCVCLKTAANVVCASHANDMKNGGRLKCMCLQNANPNNKGYLCFSSAALWF